MPGFKNVMFGGEGLFVTTLTGGAGAIGSDMRNAVELALDHLGRKMGDSNVKVFYEDDALKPDVGKQKTEKLVKIYL